MGPARPGGAHPTPSRYYDRVTEPRSGSRPAPTRDSESGPGWRRSRWAQRPGPVQRTRWSRFRVPYHSDLTRRAGPGWPFQVARASGRVSGVGRQAGWAPGPADVTSRARLPLPAEEIDGACQ